MSTLEVRKIPFAFDGAAFIWNPENPAFSLLMNQITFYVIGFEKYMCKAMRAAESVITDPEVLEEARQFRAQEAVHSLAHREHAKILIEQFPGLQTALDKAIKSYDDLYDEQPLEYHLAYAGGLEATFTPFFKMILDHRDILYSGGDARVASLFLWHFCEEIEHRSSALIVYNHVVGKSWYRIRNIPSFYRHSSGIFKMLAEEFRRNVPGIPEEYYALNPFAGIPRIAKLKSLIGVVDSQMPWHNPDHQTLPDYYQEWLSHWNAGEDVRQIYGKPIKGAVA